MLAAASAIEICRAPEIASRRLLVGPELAQRLRTKPDIARQLIFPPELVIYHPGWPLDPAQVWTAIADYLEQRGLEPKEIPPARTLEGLAGISTVSEHPRLEVRDARLNSQRNLMEFDLHCAPDNGCNPFLISMPATPEVRQASRAKFSSVETSLTGPRAHQAQGGAARPMLIRAGQPATLVLEGSGMRISMRVISLARGALGQQIRARDPEHHRVFLAEVVGEAQLHATF